MLEALRKRIALFVQIGQCLLLILKREARERFGADRQVLPNDGRQTREMRLHNELEEMHVLLGDRLAAEQPEVGRIVFCEQEVDLVAAPRQTQSAPRCFDDLGR